MAHLAGLSCEEFTDKLASSAPTPGGGGAAALVAAVGVALGNMVGSLTAGKPKYAAVEADIVALDARAQELRVRLLSLVDADAEAFAPLSAAYGLPAGTDAEREHKAAVMEGCLHDAAAVPLALMGACAEGIELCAEYARIGSALARSDAGCGAALCRAALQAASLNVFANTKLMAERAYAAELDARAELLLATWLPVADETFSAVRGDAS